MDDPRKHERSDSDHEELLPETGEDDLEHVDDDEEGPPEDDLPINDGEEAIEEEDAD